MSDERGKSYEGAVPAGEGASQPAAAPRDGEKRVALVIGNGRYASQNDILTNPENDAIALAAALSRIGFSGVRTAGDGDFTVDFSRQGVDALLDLDHRHLGRALGAMTRACAGVAQAVIYYAGHGIEVNGEPHIIPIDAKLNHISDARFETHALSVALSAIEDASGLRLVILDACRNNPFRARLFGARDLGGGLRSIEPPSNVLVAYAAKHGSTASDGGAGANSPFATALLNHIETPGLEIVDLFREVKDDVLEATSLAQEPYLYGSLGRRREYFIKAREHPASGAGPLPPDPDDRLWERIEGSERVADYEFYLEQFPQGRHAPLARFEIRRLKEVKAEAIERERAEARRGETPVLVGLQGEDQERWLAPGESMKDAPFAPELVLVLPGKFWMGSKDGEGDADERPRHEVTIGYPLLVGKYPVTFDEWDAFDRAVGIVESKETSSGLIFKKIETTREKYTPGDQGWRRGRRPVINVSWHDAQAYATWLSETTGKTYRLLSEAEWEYACRAGTETAYSFGNTIAKSQAQFSEGEWGIAKQTVEVGSFPANPFGLHDMHGNVWEWCQDAWHDNYKGAATDGSARSSADTSVRRVVRGGSWINDPGYLRSAARLWDWPGIRDGSFGFRVARSLSR